MSVQKNAAWNMAYRVFSILLPLVTAPYLARTVGREGVGLYSYAWSISEIFVIIGLLGLENYGVRAVARVREDRDKLNRTVSGIWLMQLITAGTVLLAWLVYAFLISGAERVIAISLTWMSVSCLVNLDWCLMGLDHFKPIALRNGAVKLIAAGAVFLLVRSPADLWLYGLVWSLATLAGCLLCLVSLRGEVTLVRVPLREAMKHFAPCAVLLVSVLAVRVYRTMDKVMVGALAGMEENGLYENAEKIVYCLSGFISALGTVLLPRAAYLTERGELDKVRRSLDTSMQIMMCMTCAMAFGLAAIADELAVVFYGEAFAGSGPMMLWLGFTLILIGLANVIRTQWVLPQGRDRIFVISVCSGAVVNLIINSLLIPKYHAMGAVAGTLAAELTVPLVQYLFLRKELPYGSYLRYVLTYAVIGLLMLIIVRIVKGSLAWGVMNLAVCAFTGGICYGGLCLLYWKLSGQKSILGLIGKKGLKR